MVPAGCELFHSLNQRLDRPYPNAIATFHDLFVMTGEYSTPEFRVRFADQARRAAEHAVRIIAVSQFTADEITRVLGVPASRIRVIHHGVRVPARPPAPDSERRNMILHVGALQTRKNLARLVEAFEQTPSDWQLTLAGSQGFGSEAVLARINASPRRDDIELRGYVPEWELEQLYAQARVFAFPSLDEGFGMPVLDAMATGVPVLTSNGSALREVAGDAAVLVDPHQPASIAEGLLSLIESEERREYYRGKGLNRASEFSWDTAVKQTWELYRELLA